LLDNITDYDLYVL